MIISLNEIFSLSGRPQHLSHIGSHLGEEKPLYDAAGIPKVTYVEANPDLYQRLAANVGKENCVQIAVSNTAGKTLPFYQIYSFDRTNCGCSSLLEPTKILENPYLEMCGVVEVQTTTLDILNKERGPFDFLCADTQGSELSILHGATELLESGNLKGILLEFALDSFYKGDCLLYDLDTYLNKFGYKRVLMQFLTDKHDCGDALWVKSSR